MNKPLSRPASAAPSGAQRTVHVIQGTFEVSADPTVLMSTILGSCVAVCLRDPVSRIGGMNHFLLAEGGEKDDGNERYGVYAMELVINAMLKLGADRHGLEAKVFGGARMLDNFSDIGARNAAFAADFLSNEGIDVLSSSTGGEQARRIKFCPTSGRARQLLLSRHATIDVEKPKPQPTNDVELF